MKYESRHCARPTDIMEELSVLSQTRQPDFWGLLLREGDEGKEGGRRGRGGEGRNKNSLCPPKCGGRSTLMLLVQHTILASESSLLPGCE